LDPSSIVDNLVQGISSSASGANLEVGASTMGGNGTGMAASGGGLIYTFGNNHMSANGSFAGSTPLE
jgi:hypothetical protein